MKLLIIRHGDPNYDIDSLTPKGWKEVAYLSERIARLDIRDFYVSPYGRAKDTASLTLKKMGRTAMECEWLREFTPKIVRPDRGPVPAAVCWDWLPQDWMKEEDFFYYDRWMNPKVMQDGHVGEEYKWVTDLSLIHI